MAISFVPSKVRSDFRRDKLFLFLVIIILFLLLVFGGLKVYNLQLKGRLSEVQEKIKKLEQERDKSLEESMQKNAPLLEKSRNILEAHTRVTNVFDFLEEKTFQDVQITKFAFDSENNTLTISAESSSDIALAMQTSIFRTAKEVKKVELGGISKKGMIFKFQFKLTLDEELTRFFYICKKAELLSSDEKATCRDLKAINSEQVKEKCSESVFGRYSKALHKKCK